MEKLTSKNGEKPAFIEILTAHMNGCTFERYYEYKLKQWGVSEHEEDQKEHEKEELGVE